MYKLMIVDDERLVRRGLVNVIPWKELGYVVVGEANCVNAAISLAAEEEPDIVLTDIRMPDGTGLELIEKLQKTLPNLRSVVISGYSDFEYAVNALKLRVEDYILKPIDPDEIHRIFSRIATMMDEERQQQARMDSAGYAYTEYDMIQRLYQDLQDEHFSTRYLEGQGQYRLVLIRQLEHRYDWAPAGAKEVRVPARLESFLQRHYYIRTDGILLTLLPHSCEVENYVQELLQTIGDDAPRYRIAVSEEVQELREGVSAYLAASSLLYTPADSPVLYQNSDNQKRARKNLTTLRKNLIEKLESGAQAGEVLRQIVADTDATKPDPRGAYLHVLYEVTRYFKIEGWVPSEILRRPSAGGVTAEERQTLTDAFLDDMENLTKAVRERGGSMAEVLTRKAIREIEAHYAEADFSLTRLARELNVSYGDLSSLFSKTTGKGFAAYLGEVRMEKAKGLLLRRDLKVYEVAGMVGYSNARYFSDAFKKAFGLSAGEYVARMKGGDSGDE